MPTDEGTVTLQRVDATVVLTLDAPQRRNALSFHMRQLLRDRLRQAQADDGVRCIVLQGAAGTFSAGGDVRGMAESPPPLVARERLEVLHDVVRLILRGPKPVVAAVEGTAYGAGMSLASACDHVIAADDARFSAAFGRLGLVADCGLFWTLPQRVGIGPTRDLLMTGRPVEAAEAKQLGLADAVVPPGQTLEAALAKARQYLAIAPLAIAATKSALLRRPASLEDALAIESDLQDFLRGTRDHADAAQAFLQKRPVQFQGR
jgi:2-(1,2-epoxy-1,2-dihydrophenyl)acetyl-CoA isomerase